jgi:hypothetical protein
VFVVHATKKVLDRCGGPSLSDGPTTTALGDWYATALFWKPQVALFVNEPTRLPVFVPLAPAVTLVRRFVTHLGVVLAGHGLDPRFINSELAEMTEHGLSSWSSGRRSLRIASTVSRSIRKYSCVSTSRSPAKRRSKSSWSRSRTAGDNPLIASPITTNRKRIASRVVSLTGPAAEPSRA